MKLAFRASDRRLIGAHILGDEATELIHVAQAVLHNRGTIDAFVDTTFNFPTRADAYKYAAYDGLQRLHARASRTRTLRLAASRPVVEPQFRRAAYVHLRSVRAVEQSGGWTDHLVCRRSGGNALGRPPVHSVWQAPTTLGLPRRSAPRQPESRADLKPGLPPPKACAPARRQKRASRRLAQGSDRPPDRVSPRRPVLTGFARAASG